jgi:hypothetical protein
MRMAKAVEKTPILPYDDVFIGTLIENSGEE